MNNKALYGGFFFIDDYSIKEINDMESYDYRIYVDPKSGCKVAHPVMHVNKNGIKREKSELELSYIEAKSILEKNLKAQRINKPASKRILDIKEILQKNVDKTKNMEKDIDSFLAEKQKELEHSDWAREKRFFRKASFNRDYFNWAFTITFDGALFPDEKEAERALKRWFGNNHDRKGTLVMGAFERGDIGGRLHFHGIGHFPPNFFKQPLELVTRYSTKRRKMETILESPDIRDSFGNNSFDSINNMTNQDYINEINYICDYAIKSGTYAFYNRGIQQEVVKKIDFNFVNTEIDDGIIKYVLDDDFILTYAEFLASRFVFDNKKHTTYRLDKAV